MQSGQPISWNLRRSGRARRLSVTVQRDGAVVVTAPLGAAMWAVERFVTEHSAWIAAALARAQKYRDDVVLPRGRRHYLAHKEAARTLVRSLLTEYAPAVGVRYARVAIKDMTRNWGSCSVKGNLNFNYKLLLLPPHLAAYVVVHELCHLREFNHSPAFWAQVAAVLPNPKALRKELRKYHA